MYRTENITRFYYFVQQISAQRVRLSTYNYSKQVVTAISYNQLNVQVCYAMLWPLPATMIIRSSVKWHINQPVMLKRATYMYKICIHLHTL